jgi:hypothetical protein
MSVHVTYAKDVTIDGTPIPARTASLSRTGNVIDDSNFVTSADGNTSRMTGLKDWSCEVEGHASKVQGYKAVLKKSGTATTLTTEATTNVSGKIYQITDAAKRVLDPDTAVVVADADGALDPGEIESIDYLFGKVTLDAAFTPNGSVTISGKYLPMAVIAQNRGSFGLEMSGQDLDATTREAAQSNGGWMVHQVGLIDISSTIERFDDIAGTYEDILLAGDPVLLEFNLANGALVCRGWFVLTGANADGEVSGQENEALEWALYGKTDINFGYEATASLNAGIKALLDNFFARTTVALQYLPDGTNGSGGNAYVSSVSISGDNDSEQFSATLLSAGALAAVP